MNPKNTLQATIEALDAAAVAHMVAGSFASSLHGLARTTADIDLVIDPGPGAIGAFIASLDRVRHYVDEDTAVRAVSRRDQFNVIDTQTGWKVDLIVRKDRPFSVSEFGRRIPATIVGVPVFVATAEDTILAKLEWSKIGRSERQMQDVVDIMRIRRADLDGEYLDHWARELDLVELLLAARLAG